MAVENSESFCVRGHLSGNLQVVIYVISHLGTFDV